MHGVLTQALFSERRYQQERSALHEELLREVLDQQRRFTAQLSLLGAEAGGSSTRASSPAPDCKVGLVEDAPEPMTLSGKVRTATELKAHILLPVGECEAVASDGMASDQGNEGSYPERSRSSDDKVVHKSGSAIFDEIEKKRPQGPETDNLFAGRGASTDSNYTGKVDSFRIRTKVTALQRFVQGAIFARVCAAVIIANTVYVGVITEYSIEHALLNMGSSVGPEESHVSRVVEGGFFVFYSLELILKLWVWKLHFFTAADGYWNIFDVFLVLSSIFYFTDTSGLNMMWLRTLRIFKQVIKAFRIFRVVRFFQELRIIMVSIGRSLHSFFWAMLTLALIMYMFAIVFLEGIALYLQDTPTDSIDETTRTIIYENWDSIATAMLTEYKSVTGGLPWSHIIQPIEAAGLFYHILFLAYIALLVIAVLRLLTGIFVQHAAAASAQDQVNSIRQNIVELFEAVDKDGSGYISSSEFKNHMREKVANDFLDTMHIDTVDAEKLFQMMDSSGDDRVDIYEFVEGCQRFKGPAKNIDLAMALRRLDKLGQQLKIFMGYVEVHFEQQRPSAMKPASKSPPEPLSAQLQRLAHT